MDEILSVINTLEQDDPELADELKRLAREYNHDRILTIIAKLRVK